MKNLVYLITIFILSLCLQVPSSVACKNGLIAYWSFDDSTAKDNSGNGYHGTIKNSPKPVSGVNGKGIAFQFTGRGIFAEPADAEIEGDHILLPKIPFQNYSEFTITMWVYDEEYSYFAGASYIYFGNHTTGWLGILNHKEFAITDTLLYTHYAVGGNSTTPPLSVVYDESLKKNWIFFALVYKDGMIRAYRNGEFVGEKKQDVKVTGYAGALGRHWWDNRTAARFTGKIDEVKIYCKSLTQEEIEKEYITCENSDLDQLEVLECPKPTYSGTITFPSVKIGEESSALIHIKNKTNQSVTIQKPTFKHSDFRFENATFPLVIPSQSTVELKLVINKTISGIYEDSIYINDICSVYWLKLYAKIKENPCKNGLIAYWSFDDSTAKDNSGNGYDGTIMNRVEPAKGYNGKNAFRFYGVGVNSDQGGHILLPEIDFSAFPEFSIGFWAWNEEPTFYHGESYIAFGDQTYGWLGVNNHKLIEIDNTTLFDHFAVGANPSIKPLIVNYNADLRKRWVYYVMTYDSDSLRAYRDGKFLGSIKQSININSPKLAAIARHWWTSGAGLETSSRFNGLLDDITIYCRKLTEYEIEDGYVSCDNKDLDEFEIIECPKPQKVASITVNSVKVNQETYSTIHIKNKISAPVTIHNVQLKNNNFYFAPGTFPLTISPGVTSELKIYFKKNSPGDFDDEMRLSDVCTDYIFNLHGKVIPPPCNNGLIAYWSFDDSTARDFSGNGFDGTFENGPLPAKGYKGTAIRLKGKGNYSTGTPEGSFVTLPMLPFKEYNEFTISLAAKEDSLSYQAGESPLWFGLLNDGWLGIMTANYNGDDGGGDLYTHYSISGNSNQNNDYKSYFDINSSRNKWIHYAISYKNGNVSCYRNGEFVGTFKQDVKDLQPYAAIGRHWWIADSELRSSARYNGVVDEVKMYCKALTQEEIRNDLVTCKNADLDELEISESPKPQKGSLIDFGVVGINEQKSKSLHLRNRTDQPITINKLTFANNNYYFANGVFPLTIEPFGESELQIFFKKSLPGLYQDELIISDICTQYKFILKAEIPNSPCSNGMIAYWSFDDSTANDNSGNNYNGSIRNRVEPVEGMNGNNALRFYGQESVGDLGGHILLPKIDFTTYPEFTLSFWVKNDKPSHYHGESYISFGNQTIGWLGINNHKMIEIDNGILFDHFSVGSNNSSVLPLILDYKNEYRDNWVSYAMTYKNGKLRAYRNGSFEGEIAQSVSISQPELSAIARHWWSDYGGNLNSSTRFNGIMDEVKIRCKALSDTEIETEFGPCALGFGNIFEIVGMPSNDSLLTVVFDSVGVGSVVTRKIKIRNKTDAIVYLNSVYVSENVHFSIPQSILPLKFASKEEKEIEVYLMPQQFNKLRDTLVIQDVCTTWLIALEADSYGEVDTLLGNCETNFEYSVDSLHSGYYMSLRSPRVTSSSNLVRVDFETNYEGTPQYREIELYNSIGDVVAKVQARVEYLKVYQVRNALVRQGVLSFSKENFSSGLYFIKSESGMVGLILED